jgi:hypothetical protein
VVVELSCTRIPGGRLGREPIARLLRGPGRSGSGHGERVELQTPTGGIPTGRLSRLTSNRLSAFPGRSRAGITGWPVNRPISAHFQVWSLEELQCRSSMFLTTSDLMRPIRIPTSAGRGAERPTMGSCIRCPIPTTLLPSFPAGTPRWSTGPQMEAKHNTLAQAGVRRNRLKNNTTRLSPAPDQAICDCWYKRTLAGYPTVTVNRRSCRSGLADTGRLIRSLPVPIRRLAHSWER